MSVVASQTAAQAPVLTLRTLRASILIRILDVVKELMCDCNIIFSPKGLCISSMDSNQRVYVYVSLPGEMFEEYSCAGVYPLGV